MSSAEEAGDDALGVASQPSHPRWSLSLPGDGSSRSRGRLVVPSLPPLAAGLVLGEMYQALRSAAASGDL